MKHRSRIGWWLAAGLLGVAGAEGLVRASDPAGAGCWDIVPQLAFECCPDGRGGTTCQWVYHSCETPFTRAEPGTTWYTVTLLPEREMVCTRCPTVARGTNSCVWLLPCVQVNYRFVETIGDIPCIP